MNTLHSISLILCVFFGFHFMFTEGVKIAFYDLLDEGYFGKFVGCLLWLIILAGVGIAVVVPILNLILTFGYIFVLFDKSKTKKEAKKDKKQEELDNLYYKIRNSYMVPKNINDKLRDLNYKYNEILKGEINKKLAKERYQYVLIILSGSYNNDLFVNMSKECKDNIFEMLDSTDSLFNEIIASIKEVESISNKNLESYINDKVKEFNKVTKSMQYDFKKMGKK